MNLEIFTQQIDKMSRRLDEIYKGISVSPLDLSQNLLPSAFKELGIASEELNVALEELQRQNQELALAKTLLETQRQQYQELFEFAPNSYLLTDAAGIIKEANHAAGELLNISQQFLPGKPLSIFIAEADRPNFYSQLNKLAEAQVMQEWEIHIAPRHSQIFKAMLRVANVRDRQGNVVALRVCIRNIHEVVQEVYLTKQRQVERAKRSDRSKHIFLKGEIIPLRPQAVWQVHQGIVKLSTININGEEVLLGLAGPSGVFSLDLTSLPTYQAIAFSEVQLECFPLTELQNSPELAQSILPQLILRLRQTEALLAISGQRRVQERFYQLLQLLKQEIGQPVEQGIRLSVRFRHQDLADACCSTRVTITRLLGKLQSQGKIIIDSKNHIILIEQMLQKAS